MAAQQGHLKVIEVLLEGNADVNIESHVVSILVKILNTCWGDVCISKFTCLLHLCTMLQ